MLPVASLEPHPDQPRRHFDEDAWRARRLDSERAG
jgi:hypothetical protein